MRPVNEILAALLRSDSKKPMPPVGVHGLCRQLQVRHSELVKISDFRVVYLAHQASDRAAARSCLVFRHGAAQHGGRLRGGAAAFTAVAGQESQQRIHGVEIGRVDDEAAFLA